MVVHSAAGAEGLDLVANLFPTLILSLTAVVTGESGSIKVKINFLSDDHIEKCQLVVSG